MLLLLIIVNFKSSATNFVTFIQICWMWIIGVVQVDNSLDNANWRESIAGTQCG